MIKLLRIIHSVNPEVGGPPEGISQITPILNKYGIETTVVCLDNPSSEWLINKPYEVIAFGKGFLNYGFQIGMVFKLNALIKKYDVVIIHGVWQYHSLATFLSLKKLNIKYYLFTHGMLDPWFQEKYPLKHLKKLIYWKLFESKVVRGAEAILFTSKKEEYLSRGWIDNLNKNKKIINYGITSPPNDSEKLKKIFLKKFPIVQNKKIILFLSRIDYKKGIDLLISAFGKISQEFYNHILVVAGPPAKNPKLSLELNSLIKFFGLEEKILFTGMLKGDLKWGAYYSSDFYCLPSHSENFGIVVAEALSCGCLIGISNKVNIYKEVQNAKAGLIFNDTEKDTLRIIRKMLKLSFKEREDFRKNARSLFEDKFNLSNNTNKLVEILKESI